MQEKDIKQNSETKDDSLYREKSIGLEETAIKEQEAPSSNSRIAKNALMLYIRMFLTMIVGLYTSRVVLNTLGVEDYGIYGVVGGVVAMLGFLNASMSGATSRFLTFELGRGNKKRLADTFSSAMIVHIGIALVVFVLAETVGLWFLVHKLVIPEERMTAAHWVYQCSILSAMLNVTQVPYNATIIAHEKMDVYAYVEILNVTLKLLIVYLLTIGNFDKLVLYALLVLTVSVLIMMVYRIYCIRHFSESHFHWSWNSAILRPLLIFSSQTIIANMSYSFREQGILFALNMVFGVIANAASAITSVINGVISQFSFNVLAAFNPRIIKLYAIEKVEESCRLIILASRYSTLLLLLIIIPFFFETEQILSIWLTQVPKYTIQFSRLMVFSLIMTSMTNSIYVGLTANGNIKYFSFLQSLLYMSCPVIGYFLCCEYRYPEIVYLVIIACQLFLGVALIAIFKNYVSNFPISSFFKSALVFNIIPAFISFFFCGLLYNMLEQTITRLLILIGANSIVLSLFTYICLSNKEKEHLRMLVRFLRSR